MNHTRQCLRFSPPVHSALSPALLICVAPHSSLAAGACRLLTLMAFRSQDSRQRRIQVTAAATVALTLTLFVGSWTWRNQRQLGKPIWATTHGGYTLLLGNNPSYYQYLNSDAPIGQAWDARSFLERWDHRLESDPRLPEFWQRLTRHLFL